jgi:hypothetical protein
MLKEAKMLRFPLLSLVLTLGYSLMGGNISDKKMNRLTLLVVCKEAGLEVNAK